MVDNILDSALLMTSRSKRSNFRFEYLCEIAAKFEKP